MVEFILASTSPRRKELLEMLGIDFEVAASDADESVLDGQDLPAYLLVQELALLKASAAAKMVLGHKHAILIGADTVVCCGGTVLGKPKNQEDACRMLQMLSGRTHEVYTGICVMRVKDGFTVCDRACTKVKFKKLTEEQIKNYIHTGEPVDKAGAYGIQGRGTLLVEGIEGDYFNVVGLPLSLLADVLQREFDINLLSR